MDAFDQAMEQAVNAVRPAFEAVAHETVAEIKESLSTDYPPASKPGEFPHRRMGRLQDGVGVDLEETATEFVAEFTSVRVDGDPRVPYWLEVGTPKMLPRPYWGAAQKRARNEAVPAIGRLIRGT